MKISALVLPASLAANVALVAFVIVGAMDDSAVAKSADAAAAKENLPPPRATDVTPGAETWAALKSGDLKEQLARLRAEDFPPTLSRAILAAQIHEGFATRRKALEAKEGEQPYWKNPRPDPAMQAEWNGLWRDEQKAVKDLLGSDPDTGLAATLRRQLPDLSDEKIETLTAIRERIDQQRQDLAMTFGNTWLPEEQAKYQAFDQVLHDEFAATLTPQELEDYDLRTGRTANQLRNTLSAFDVTEQEFRSLFKLQSAFDGQFPSFTSSPSEEQMKARSEAQKQLSDDIKAALGDQRFTDYQRATNYNFRQTSQLVARLDLPPETTNQIYAVQQDTQQRASAIRRAGGSPDAVAAQLSALADEAQAKITTTLGASGGDAYKQYGGQWLQNLRPRPPKN